jgi:cell division initiation protein
MRISPLSIKRQEFKKVLRGYDAEEVHAFLSKLSDEVEEIQLENDSLKKQLEQANDRIAEFVKIEKNLQETLLKAQESSSKSIESTKKQTNLMIKEAEIKAAQIIEKARESTNEIRNAVIRLREEKDLLIARLKSIVNSQAQLLEMKVSDAGSENVEAPQIEPQKKTDIDVDEIVKRLL